MSAVRTKTILTIMGMVSLVGCSAAVSPAPSGGVAAITGTPAPSTAGAARTSAPSVPTPLPTLSSAPRFELAGEDGLFEQAPVGGFSNSAVITNRWLPFVPGSQWVFEGSALNDGERFKRKVVNTTTDLIKVIGGVVVVVNYELDYDEGELVEAELSFLAQADDGTVWHFGEYPEEYEEGKFIEAPSWIAGYEDAHPGVMMLADPQTATPSYSEGWGPAVGWNDRGRVFETGSSTCVKAGCFKPIVVIDEFNRNEPDAHQLKYYADGVGGVRVGWAGAKEDEQEVLELVRKVQLDAAAMAKIRAAALALDAHAYKTSPDVYSETGVATPR
jgi:hypothetical protein